MKPITRSLICLLAVMACRSDGAPVTQIVSFGDSLSDTGNAAVATGGQYPGSNYSTGLWNGAPPYPVLYTDGTQTRPAAAGAQGLWVDQLAVKLGVARPAPALVGGTNFAVASAQSGFGGQADVGTQVIVYSTSPLSGAASRGSLFTMWAGANDLFTGAANGAVVADQVATDILYAFNAGARQFLWLDLPLLGETPKGAAGNAADLNARTAAFNGEWQTDLYHLRSLGINVVGVDVNGLFGTILADHAAGCTVRAEDPYCFANVSTPAQGQDVDPNSYLFWDAQHPTTAADALIAQLAYADLLAVPEPASVWLALAGLGLLTVAKCRVARLEVQ